MTISRPMFFTEAKRQAEKEYTYEVDELDYEQKVDFKWRIFEFICRDVLLNTCHDVAINKLLEKVDHIYKEITKI